MHFNCCKFNACKSNQRILSKKIFQHSTKQCGFRPFNFSILICNNLIRFNKVLSFSINTIYGIETFIVAIVHFVSTTIYGTETFKVAIVHLVSTQFTVHNFPTHLKRKTQLKVATFLIQTYISQHVKKFSKKFSLFLIVFLCCMKCELSLYSLLTTLFANCLVCNCFSNMEREYLHQPWLFVATKKSCNKVLQKTGDKRNF